MEFIKKIIIYFVVLSSNDFFGLKLFPERFREILETGAIGLIISLLLLYRLYYSNQKIKKHFNVEIFLFLLSVFFSMFIAKNYHYQDLKITLIAQRFMYFYALYFLLHEFNFNMKELEKLIVSIGFIYVGLFFIQYLIHPLIFLDVRIDIDRGTLRIFLPGGGFVMYTYFKYLQIFLSNQKIKDGIILIVFYLVAAVLPGTRQILASVTLLTMVFIFFNSQVKSRLLIIFLSLVAGTAIFFILYDMFINLILLTQQQAASEETNIRVLSMRFFMSDFMPSKIAYFLGNGQDSTNSIYGQKIEIYRWVFGFFQSDIGLIGDYSKFGLLFVVAQLSIFAKVIFVKLNPELDFLKYLFISFSLTLFSGRNLLGTGGGIVFIMLILFLIDCYKTQSKIN